MSKKNYITKTQHGIMQNSPYHELANAIIVAAVEDWRDPPMNHGKIEPYCSHENLKSFFRSRWFSVLTSLDPEYLIEKLEKE